MHQFLRFIFGMKLYMFRTVSLSIIRSFSLYAQQWYMSCRFADTLRARSGWNYSSILCGGTVGWGTALQVGWSRVRFPMVLLEFFIDNPSGRTVALGFTQPLTETITSNISWRVEAAGAWGWQPYHIPVPNVLKSGSPNLLEPYGPVQACHGIALPLLMCKKPHLL
jgi:hypothetical protein